ncbi:MAG: hypothetical protein LC687_00080 [Actinobacteria bacterium]|nr:hypothetical protein [Actinomycetota bacterium]
MAHLACICDWTNVFSEEDPSEPVISTISHWDPACLVHRTVKVTIFKESGKYYTEERWAIPEGAIAPYDMDKAPEAQKWKGWQILVNSQEPWGYPHLLRRQ